MMGMVFLIFIAMCVFWGIVDLLGLYPKGYTTTKRSSFTTNDYEQAIKDPSHPLHNLVTYDMLQWLHETDPSEFSDFHHGG